jgi:hypothetical protein
VSPADLVLDALQGRAAAAKGAKLFVVLDGARDDVIWPEVMASGNPATCLFAGDKAPELESASPWLVELGNGQDRFTDWVVRKGWGQSWGVFALSTETRANLAKHFRQFLLVRRGGKQVYFRFYDPRVLRVYLPTCDAADLEVVMGKRVLELLMEDKDPATLLRFTPGEGKVVRTEVALRPAVAGGGAR